MREIELKIILDAAQEKELRTSAIVRECAIDRPRTETLHSIYYDTADGALRARGIALRLRHVGRRWIQTVKRADGPMMGGLSTPEEFEFPVRGQNLALERVPSDDLREFLLGCQQNGLVPVVETCFRRTRQTLRTPGGALAELAIDVGELRGGVASKVGLRTAPLMEAELELKEGGSAVELYALAARIFTRGPIRFAEESKSARAAALLEDTPAAPRIRKARPLALTPEMTAEQAATEIMAECLAHYTANLAVLFETDRLEGPHQTRVALRRLRSALAAFGSVLGKKALAPWGELAREIAAEAGRLRDLDVLIEELVAPHATRDPKGFGALVDGLSQRRDEVRVEVRKRLAAPDITRFCFDLSEFLAGRRWIEPSDNTQTQRLAQPLGSYAAAVLDKRWKAVSKYGVRLDELTIDERHEMRKELKKYRYLLDAFRGLYPPAEFARLIRCLKDLQTAFGALNDHAMAEALLSAPDAPCATDPLAQRAVGRVFGYLEAKAESLWPDAQVSYAALKACSRPWRRHRAA